jgi:hypothetical protein
MECDVRTLAKECLRVQNLYFIDSVNELLIVLEKKYSIPKSEDMFRRLKFILNAIETSKKQERFLYRPLLYIKQNYGYLRHKVHSTTNFSETDIGRVIRSIADIIACLELMKESDDDPNLITAIKMFKNFYSEFLKVAREFKISIVMESFTEPKEDKQKDEIKQEEQEIEFNQEEIPQEKTIKWYKDNGFRNFIRKKIIIPQDGKKLVGKSCIILKYNGNQTKVLCEDNDSQRVEYLLPVQTTIKWV